MAADELLRRLPLVVDLDQLPTGGELGGLPLKRLQDVRHLKIPGVVVYVEPGTDNIQAAVDALPSTGGTVHLKAGTYTITTAVSVTKANVEIRGAGQATILDVTTASLIAISITGDYCVVRNLRMHFNAATGIQGIIINADNCLVNSVAIVVVTGGHTRGISYATGIGGRVSNCTLDATAGTLASGVYMESTHADGSIVGCSVVGVRNGFGMIGRGHVIGCTADGGNSGIVLGLDAGATACVVRNAVVYGIGNDTGSMRNTIIGCHVLDCVDIGIWLQEPFSTIIGNVIRNNGSHGISLFGENIYSDEANKTIISGNLIEGNGGDGIIISDKLITSVGVFDSVISGNIIRGNTGIGINEKSPSDNNLLFGNHVRTNTGGNIVLTGANSLNLDRENVEASTGTTASPNVLIADESGKTITNEGVTEENFNTLPAAEDGLEFTFYCHDTDGIRATAASGDTIRIAAGVSAGAGFVRSIVIGDSVTLRAINATEWVAVALGGNNWTIDV